MTDGQDRRRTFARYSTRAALASVTLALILLIAKAWAAYATGSTAMLGSLADTALDVIASLTTLARRAHRGRCRPTSDHRFGHGKAEALVALAQVALITVSAIGIALARGRPADQRRADRGDGDSASPCRCSRSPARFALLCVSAPGHRAAPDRSRSRPTTSITSPT